MASFAHLQCRLLRAGTARVELRAVLATVYAGNALSSSVPFAGSQMSVVFVFRRFKRLGVEATVAGWTLVVAGLISSLASALLLVVGAVLTGNDIVAATGAAAGIVGVAILVVATAAVRRPAVLTALQRPAGWTLRHAWGVLGRPERDPDAAIASLAARLGSLRLPASGWATVVMAALVNWLADMGVLAASIVAVGAAVPWRGLLFAYGVGTAAGSVGVIPGGLGVVEAALALSLMGAGVRHPLALAAVLMYRLISFWMIIAVGWLTYLFGARARWGDTLGTAKHRVDRHETDCAHGIDAGHCRRPGESGAPPDGPTGADVDKRVALGRTATVLLTRAIVARSTATPSAAATPGPSSCQRRQTRSPSTVDPQTVDPRTVDAVTGAVAKPRRTDRAGP